MNSRRLGWLMNIMLAGLILWAGANIVMTWASNRGKGSHLPSPKPENAHSNTIKMQKSVRLASFQPTISRDIFKTTKSVGRSKIDKPLEQIEPTKLNLTLRGTGLRQNEGYYAIIEDGKTRVQDLYYLDSFVQGAQIVKIASDRVILRIDDKEEALIMSFENRASSAARKLAQPPQREVVQRPQVTRPSPRPRPPTPSREEEVEEEEEEDEEEEEEEEEEKKEVRPPERQPPQKTPPERPTKQKEGAQGQEKKEAR